MIRKWGGQDGEISRLEGNRDAYVHVKKLATACPPMTHMEAAAAMDTFRGWTGPQGAKPRWQLATFIRDSHLMQQAVEELSAGWGEHM